MNNLIAELSQGVRFRPAIDQPLHASLDKVDVAHCKFPWSNFGGTCIIDSSVIKLVHSSSKSHSPTRAAGCAAKSRDAEMQPQTKRRTNYEKSGRGPMVTGVRICGEGLLSAYCHRFMDPTAQLCQHYTKKHVTVLSACCLTLAFVIIPQKCKCTVTACFNIG
jgi:hypothetical protein